MDLIVNGTAVARSSLGARRYYEGVMRHLHWPGKVEVTPLARWSRLERVKELLERGRPEAVFWSPSHRGPVFAHRHVVTVLDCINVEYVYRNDWRLPALRLVLQTMLGNAATVVAISRATRDAVLRNFDLDRGKVMVIEGPVDLRDGAAGPIAAAEPLTQPDGDYVLMITNALPHKNTALAGRAFAASSAAKRGVGLRIVGSMDPIGVRACEAAGVKVGQHRGVEDNTLNDWLSRCRFLFAPSLEEGHDLPVAEALSRGANVLCSDIPVHREFYDGAALFCDPSDPKAMTEALDDALGRSPRWGLRAPAGPQRSFADVASDYRALFERVARGEPPLTPLSPRARNP
jgi:glycosyltransferase involved in cell wall biosynthesis